MKMIDTETGHEMVEVSGHDKKEYASKGVAGTGLGLGIAGTALWLLSGGLGGGLFGNRMGAAGAVAAGVEKEDKCELINGIDSSNAWDLVCHFKEAVCENTDIDEEDLFEIMKDFHERLAGKHFNEPYAIYQVSQMYHTNNKGVKIDTPLFSIENAKKIYDRRIRPLNKDVTMWDVYVALNAQYHDNIDLYEKWFSNVNDSEIEEKIIEATIANWFEDEDASSDKVWEYFRVI